MAAWIMTESTSGQERTKGRILATIGGLQWSVVLPLAAALALGLGLLQILGLIVRPLAILLLAITLAEALRPIVHGIERVVQRRTVAVTLLYVAIALILAAAAWLLAPPLIDQGRDLLHGAPELIGQLRSRITRINAISEQDISRFTGALQQRFSDLAFALPRLAMEGLLTAVIVIFLSIYWLITSRSIRRFGLSLIPVSHRQRTEEVLTHMSRSMGGYVRGLMINAFIMGVLAYVGLLVLGVPYPLALGVLTMFGEIVPFVGPVMVGIIVTGIALLQSLTRALLAAGLYTALQQIEGHLLTPNIMRSQTDVSQTLVLFAILVGGVIGGILGVLVSIPAAAAFRVLVVDVLAPAERRMIDHHEELSNGDDSSLPTSIP